MAYTNVWDDTKPTGSEAANTIDDIFRSVKVDLEQRFIDLFNMANFTADPLRPGGLKFYDTADAKLFFGDNAGTPRGILLRNKADSLTYAQWLYTGITLSPPALTVGSTPFLNVAQTWNNVATTFVGILVNITNTNSSVNSLFFDYQVGGVSQWKVSRTGVGTLVGSLTSAGIISTTISASTSLAIASTTKLYLDGVAASGDSYIWESSANNVIHVVGGVNNLTLTATTAVFGSIAVSGITTLNASGTSTLQGLTATSVSVNNGPNSLTTTLATTNGNVGASVVNRAAFGNSSSANTFTIDIYGGGHAKSSQVEIFNNVAASLALGTSGVARLTIDSGGNTTFTGIIRNDTASGGFALGVVSSVPRITYNSGTTSFGFLTAGNGDATLTTGHLYAESDAIFDIGQSATLLRYRDLFLSRNITLAGSIFTAIGGEIALTGGGSSLATTFTIGRWNGATYVTIATFSADLALTGNMSVAATKKLFVDGGGDTYLIESSANILSIVVGGVTMATWSSTFLTINTFNGALFVTSSTLSDAAAGFTATMTNSPTAGNPKKWINFTDNGITRYIPTW